MRNKYLIPALMCIMVPIAGELKYFPFQSSFRISFGIPLFFFFLLFLQKETLISAGFFVGISVVIFRISLDWEFYHNISSNAAFMLHFPTFFYYITYACLFYFIEIVRFKDRPFLVGSLSVLIEVISAVVELSVRHLVLQNSLELSKLNVIIVVAIIRSFFTLGFFYGIQLHEIRLVAEQQQEQNKQMLLFISNLYEESIQLKKSLRYAEEITREGYELYRNLQGANAYNKEELAEKILAVTGKIHEIKKDNQRIYAGLAKMISEENKTEYMEMREIVRLVVNTNEKYSISLNKEITFEWKVEEEIPPMPVYTILSLLNNLVSNSVEAIERAGCIKVNVSIRVEQLQIQVEDNGSGIPKKKRELIFKPGYTTKYDSMGNPSTGIGLSYIQEVVKNLNGKVELENSGEGKKTIFTIELPLNDVIRKG